MDYNTMRTFADSWGLLGMALFFLFVVFYAFRPAASRWPTTRRTFLSRMTQMTDKQIDDVTGVATTGHEWDGIKELDNPMPRWWLWTFYATIFWALAYVIAYPAPPLISSSTGGVLGWSSRGAFWEETAKIDSERQGIIDQIKAKDVHEILADRKPAPVCDCRRRRCLSRQLRAMPRFWRTGRTRLSEPQR